MATGTFPKIGTGASDDPFRPDFSSVESPTTEALFRLFISETPTTITCEYELVVLADGNAERLRRRAQNQYPGLFNDTIWATLTAAQRVDLERTALQDVFRYILRGAP